jgi:hypothetical protein
VIHRAPACTTPVRSHTFFSSAYELRKLGECTLHRRADPQRIPDVRFAHEDAVAGEHVAALDERHHPRRDGFMAIVSPAYEHRKPVLWPGQAVLPRRFRSSALPRLRCGSASHRITGARLARQKSPGSSRCRRTGPITMYGVIHSSCSPRVMSRVHKECRSTGVPLRILK